MDWAYDNFVGPSELCGVSCTPTAVYTPAEFWPNTGLDSLTFDESVAIGLVNLEDCLGHRPCTVTDPPYTSSGVQILGGPDFTVFGYSDSATIASIAKSNLIAHPPAGVVTFVLVSSGNRPNGGILERFVGVHLPILGVTFNGATVTNSPQPTPLTTVDVVHQYDLVADFPTNPLNLLAALNALIEFAYDHPEFRTGTPMLQGQFQDSTYYMFPAETLPLVRPLTAVPYLGPLLATVLDPRCGCSWKPVTTGPSTRAPRRPRSTSTSPTRSRRRSTSWSRCPPAGTTGSPTSPATPPTGPSTPRRKARTGWADRR